MRILILDEWVPYPLDSGKKIRTFNLLRHIRQLGEVTYVCYENAVAAQELSAEIPGIRLIHVPDRRPEKKTLLYHACVARNVVRELPFAAEYADTTELRTALADLLTRESFDLILCEWTPYAHFLESYDHACKVLMTHNVEYLQWERLREASSNPIVKLMASLQRSKMKRYESRVFKKFSFVSVVSEEDQRLLQHLAPRTESVVVENGVDLDYFFHDAQTSRSACAVFSASMDAFSNEDAAIFYAQEIHPLVLDEVPQAEFMILGRNPTRRVRQLASIQGVTVTGTVDDVRPFLKSSAVSVVPLRVGGGTRLKILEAMSVGLPVISTSIGAEGLAVKNGEHLIVADDPAGFAEQVSLCLQDRQYSSRLSKNALTLVQSRYSWDKIGEQLASHLRSLVADSAANTGV